jgi:hypothetical protein
MNLISNLLFFILLFYIDLLSTDSTFSAVISLKPFHQTGFVLSILNIVISTVKIVWSSE